MALNNKTAIVTGGSRGLGKAMVEALVKRGCKVAFTYKSGKEAALCLQEQVKGRTAAYCLDVRNTQKIRKMVDEVKREFGGLDILINNAGVTCDKALMMMKDRDWHDIIDTNLNGTYNMTRACIVTLMKQKEGCIINISSVSGIVGLPGQTNYAASKAGIIGFTKALAKEVGPFNIRVNVIAPGFIQTDMLKDSKKKEGLLRSIPFARFGQPCEVAELAAFLASSKAEYITGEVIRIDGGLAI
jgi:3-oxoacyl-[acyl-carrier protein] reductase